MTAELYRARSYPTVLVLTEDGEEIDRVVGYYRAPEFMTQVEDYLAGRNTLASMIGEEPAKRDSADFIYRLGDRFANDVDALGFQAFQVRGACSG